MGTALLRPDAELERRDLGLLDDLVLLTLACVLGSALVGLALVLWLALG